MSVDVSAADGQPSPGILWTVGHSRRSASEFLELLQAHGIERVADVRRFPGSRAFPHFHPDALAHSLAGAGISYSPMTALGGRRRPLADSPHQVWRNESFRGYADYMDTAEFAAAAHRLATEATAGHVAIMCAEAVWWRCHRSMIADWFKARGWDVRHVLGAHDAREHPYTSAARIVNGELTY